MELIDKLNDLKKRQKELGDKYEDIIKDAEKSLNIIENEKLKKYLLFLNNY